MCIEKGFIQKAAAVEMERRQPIMALPHFSKTQIRNAYIWFDYHVYKGFKPLWKILVQVALVKISSSPTVLFLYQKVDRFLESSLFRVTRLFNKKICETNTP
jgi:hypothetical protein